MFGPSLGNMDPTATFNSTPVKEVYSSAVSSPGPISRPSSGGEMTFSILETPDMKPDQETAEKFRAAFAYDEKETLLGCASLIGLFTLIKTYSLLSRFSGIYL